MFTTQQFNELAPWLRPHHELQAAKIQAIRDEPYVPYSQERLADMPEDILSAHQLARDEGQKYRPYLERAQQLAESGSRGFPGAAQEYMNPYQEQVTRRIAEEGMRNFREQMLPALESQFVRAGQHGSTRHRELASRAARDIQNEILSRQAQSMAAGYQISGEQFNKDMERRIESAREHGLLGGMKQAGLATELGILGEHGRYQQQQKQARL